MRKVSNGTASVPKLMMQVCAPSWIVAAMCAVVLTLGGCSKGEVSNADYYTAVTLPIGALALDGDTFMSRNESIRLKRIDAPELPDHTCPAYGRKSCVDSDPVWAGESKRYLQDILDSHQVKCAKDTQLDVYGRTLAECYIVEEDGSWSNINNLMLTSGMAVPYRR